MGDDFYNPFTAQTHVKPVPIWKPLLGMAVALAALYFGAWVLISTVFSLQRIF